MRAKSFSVIWLALLLLLACEQKQGLPPADIKPSSTVSPNSMQPSQAIPSATPNGVSASTPMPVSTANLCPITTKIFTSAIDANLYTLIPEECQEQFVDFQHLVQLKSLGSKPIVLPHKTLANNKTLFLELYKCNLPSEIKENGEYDIHVVGHLKSGQIVEGNIVTTTIKKLSVEDCRRTGGGASLNGP